MAIDSFSDRDNGLGHVYTNVALVTPSNDTDLTHVTRGVSFAVAGTLEVITHDGSTVTIPEDALAPGVIHRLRVSRIRAENTSATGIVAYF